ncbi:Protein of unknown function DUF3537 [Dillenia turbinata]|uniref:Uncharacterized protein n=1 Tax=Dillenia turbinata TaxID=194707 RepID=A0AAN8YYP2_9MAGN
MEYGRESFLPSNKSLSTGYMIQEGNDALKNFRSCLSWLCVDQSNPWRASLSWSVFFLLVIGVPLFSHFLLSCSSCDSNHQRPYDAIVQLSLSSVAALSFICLSSFARKYGLRKFLFLDKLCNESETIRQGYTEQLQRSMKILLFFVLPCFAGDSAYKLWWYITGSGQIPYYINIHASYTIACTLELCSWLYRTSIFIFICVVFRMTCHLQILRIQDFARVFQIETEVASVLKEHLRLRRNLRVISHRFLAFILLNLVFVTASQLASLLITTKSGAEVDIYKTGELALCSIALVTGLFICLRSATKITHKAQSVTCLASKWHVCATINSFDGSDGETPTTQIASCRVYPITAGWDSSEEEDGDDDLDNTRMLESYSHTISFQKRQALVTYLENNKAGITVYGFMLDRTWLHTIFGIELSLVLWLLSKTIGIS